MQAITHRSYGSTDVLELDEIDTPQIAADEVLVRVRAAGVDRGVWHIMTGLPYPIRLAGYGLRAPKHPVLGTDVAGVVEAVGNAVTRFAPGDEVLGFARGSFAAYAPAKETKLVAKPAGLTFEEAAALGVSGVTALQAVRDHGTVLPGHQVLVIGASGGVGTYAVQVAKGYGAQVTGVCSTTKVDLVRALGADRVVDHTRADVTTGGPYDVVLDIGGNTPLSRLRAALTPTGTLVIVGSEGGKVLGGTDRQLRAMVVSRFSRRRLGTFIAKEDGADLAALVDLVEQGTLRPAVDRAFPLADAAKAIRYLQEGHARGKVVLTP